MESHLRELSPDASRALVDQLAEFPHPPMLVVPGDDQDDGLPALPAFRPATDGPSPGSGRSPRSVSDADAAVNDGKGTAFIGHTRLIHPGGFLPAACGMFPPDFVAAVYQNSPVFRLVWKADGLEEKCGACEHRYICGGSRARPFVVTGNLLAQEPEGDYGLAAWQTVVGTRAFAAARVVPQVAVRC